MKRIAAFGAGLLIVQTAKADIIEDLNADILGDFLQVTSSLGLNCASTPDNWSVFVEEAAGFVANIADYMSQQLLQLALAKDYPQMCDVIDGDLQDYQESEVRWRARGKKIFDPTVVDAVQISPSYKWPKYFIDVSDKGSDPLSLFVKNNELYKINRGIASLVEPLMDTDGAIKLATFLAGSTAMQILGFTGLNSINPNDVVKAAVALPAEKLRIRASHVTDQAAHEVDIWPVAMSETGGRMSVCYGLTPETIGFGWPIPGVPNTCPIAMTRDAAAYWDTGMIDYMDPQTSLSVTTASNVASCVGDQAASAALNYANQPAVTGNFLGNMTDALQSVTSAMRSCSWPILGAAQAIASSALDATNAARWTGPHCTIWGPLAPRSSTTTYFNDYTMANSALKFKTLAHQIFGIPRANGERWQLVLPWEDSAPGSIPGPGGAILNSIQSFSNSGLSKTFEKMGIPTSPIARSRSLMFPGDPRLFDISLNPSEYASRGLDFAKESGYLLAMAGLSSQTGDIARLLGVNNAAAQRLLQVAPWVGAELLRREILARDIGIPGVPDTVKETLRLPGKHRTYAIWQSVQCKAHFLRLERRGGFTSGNTVLSREYYDVPDPDNAPSYKALMRAGPSCRGAFRFEIYKKFQLKWMRKFCDLIGHPLGRVFRNAR